MRSCTIPSFIQPSDSFDSPNSPVPANGAPLSVLIRAGTPYSRMAASQIARTWLRSIGEYETRTEWHRVFAWSNLSKFAKTLQKGQLITLEGSLRYRDVEDEVEGTRLKHRIAEVHAASMKRLSKIETADDPTDGAADE
jgi:single-strand DNA-binding protein